MTVAFILFKVVVVVTFKCGGLQHWSRLRSTCYGTLTALIMLVWPDPGIQPVTTITMSPDLKNPLAFPEEGNTGECVSEMAS